MKAWFDLEYASQVWDPYLQKDIKLLEGVQKFALRVCTKNYDNSYEDLLDTFQLPELSTRRLNLSEIVITFLRLFMFIFLHIFLYPCPLHCVMLSHTCIASLVPRRLKNRRGAPGIHCLCMRVTIRYIFRIICKRQLTEKYAENIRPPRAQ